MMFGYKKIPISFDTIENIPKEFYLMIDNIRIEQVEFTKFFGCINRYKIYLAASYFLCIAQGFKIAVCLETT